MQKEEEPGNTRDVSSGRETGLGVIKLIIISSYLDLMRLSLLISQHRHRSYQVCLIYRLHHFFFFGHILTLARLHYLLHSTSIMYINPSKIRPCIDIYVVHIQVTFPTYLANLEICRGAIPSTLGCAKSVYVNY